MIQLAITSAVSYTHLDVYKRQEFNEMLDRMQVMAQEELQHKMLVERTEYKMLQAQINPHFLYNTCLLYTSFLLKSLR